MMQLSPKQIRLVLRMEAHGYSFDDLSSYKGHLVFTCLGMIFPLVFSKWYEVADYISSAFY